MKRLITTLLLILSITSSFSQNQQTIAVADTSEISKLIVKYGESIDNADSVLASKLFSHSTEVSFIHPRGYEHGWKEINRDIYNFFSTTFSKRKLNIFNEHINIYENVAWAEFYWVFDAIFKKDGSPLQTKGRETQIWRKINNEWHLVHVHYSNMPVTAERQGF